MKQWLSQYLAKMRGGGNSSPHPLHWRNAFCSWLGSFIGVALIGWLAEHHNLSDNDNFFLIGSFGATAILVYGAPTAPFAQPRYLIGGQIVAALVGVTVYKLVPDPLWLSAALVVSTAVVLMYFTKTMHPPAGATGLIAVIGSDQIHALGYWYVLDPVLYGTLILFVVALLINNISPLRKYPNYWF